MILHVNIIVQINVEFAFRERNEIFVLITNPVMSTAVAMACIPDDEARVINSHKAFANWLTKGNQCVYSRVPMLTLLKSVRSWGQLIYTSTKDCMLATSSSRALPSRKRRAIVSR